MTAAIHHSYNNKKEGNYCMSVWFCLCAHTLPVWFVLLLFILFELKKLDKIVLIVLWWHQPIFSVENTLPILSIITIWCVYCGIFRYKLSRYLHYCFQHPFNWRRQSECGAWLLVVRCDWPELWPMSWSGSSVVTMAEYVRAVGSGKRNYQSK